MRKAPLISAAVSAVALSVTSCGGGGNEEAYCASVETYYDEVSEALEFADSIDQGSIDDLEASQAKLEATGESMEVMIANAPSDIAEALETLRDTEHDTRRISEQEAVDEARTKVNEHIADVCDLDITL